MSVHSTRCSAALSQRGKSSTGSRVILVRVIKRDQRVKVGAISSSFCSCFPSKKKAFFLSAAPTISSAVPSGRILYCPCPWTTALCCSCLVIFQFFCFHLFLERFAQTSGIPTQQLSWQRFVVLSINAHICARKCAEKLLASPYFGKMTFFGKIKIWQNNALAKWYLGIHTGRFQKNAVFKANGFANWFAK